MSARSKPALVPLKVVWSNRCTMLGLAWLIGFVVFFSWFDLPNNRPATRSAVWQAAPLQVLEILWPLPDANAPSSSGSHLPQRLPAIGVALLMLGAAIGLGTLALSPWDLKEFPRAERLFFAGGIGLSLWSLITLGLGLAGCLIWAVFWSLIFAGNCLAIGLWQAWMRAAPTERNPEPASRWLIGGVLIVCVPIVWAMLLGACTPQTDFDVVEYHLNGPKEWFQQGAVTFLPHNVYTSFPFLTEMLLLSGMVLTGDWLYGALAGQIVLMAFAPLTALGLYCAGRRWFSESAGWLAVLVFLTTPWTYRISIIAYAEGGLSYYILASFLAAGWALRQELTGACLPSPLEEEGPGVRWGSSSRNVSPEPFPSMGSPSSGLRPISPSRGEGKRGRLNFAAFLLPGFLAGSAMACKYPGLTSVVLPIGLGIAMILLLRRISFFALGTAMTMYGLGVLCAVGPWLLKNGYETGNPVYPLLYSVFGGRDFDPETNLRWVKAHAAPVYGSILAFGVDAVRKLADIVANNDWHSPLLYGLAPLSLCWTNRRKEILSAWLYVGWLFLTWFLLTHHIDRFWVPMIPVVALLSGAGAASLNTPVGKFIGGTLIAACIGFNLTICSLIGGYNAGLTDLRQAQRIAESALTPELHWLNEEFGGQRLPAEFKLLCVGEAATFHARFPVVYNTVFDRCWLEEWCARGAGPDYPLKTPEEMREMFRSHRITHVFVNWREILRYREPGSYGYTDFVHPDRIRQLQEIGVLGPALRLPHGLGIASLQDDRRRQLEAWAPALILKQERELAYLSGQIFPVHYQPAAQARDD